MLAVITRPMVIATDAGTAKQFVPEKDKATGEDVPQTMSESEFGRLRRAGAAQRFIEVNHAEAEAEPAEGTSGTGEREPIRGSEEAMGGSGVEIEAGPGADNQADSGVEAATVVAPVAKAKAGRKPKA